MISLEEARAVIAGAIQARPSVSLSFTEALGRVLAEDVRADGDYPAVDRSMMDGYAICYAGTGQRLRVVAEIQAGSVPTVELQAGECARIFTGAELPKGAVRVIPQEEADRDGEWMTIRELPLRPYVRKRGAEARLGDTILRAGAPLGPTELAILAQVGAVHVPVVPAAQIEHVTTGNELLAPDAPLQPGHIRDTNSSLIAGLLRGLGAELTRQSRCGDELEHLTTLARGFRGDLLLISGGASVGDFDFGARALRDAGFRVHFDKVNLRPGKPLTFATRESQAAFVIPGNPVSHYVCFQVAIRFAIERLQSLPSSFQFVKVALAGSDTLRGDARQTYWPATVSIRDGALQAEPRRWSSSGDTFSLAGTNALLRVDADCAPGSMVSALIFGFGGFA